MENVICRNCGSINDYRTSKSGPHIKAVCNSCDKYIKFLPQTNVKKMAEEKKEDNLLPGGLRFFNPNAQAPEFVVGELVISLNELITYCKENPQHLSEYEGKKQLKVQLLISKNDKLYGRVNNYKKEDAPAGKRPARPGGREYEDLPKGPMPITSPDDDLPF
jgi:hypothetical protein